VLVHSPEDLKESNAWLLLDHLTDGDSKHRTPSVCFPLSIDGAEPFGASISAGDQELASSRHRQDHHGLSGAFCFGGTLVVKGPVQVAHQG
jgi:hypothetical protein